MGIEEENTVFSLSSKVMTLLSICLKKQSEGHKVFQFRGSRGWSKGRDRNLFEVTSVGPIDVSVERSTIVTHSSL